MARKTRILSAKDRQALARKFTLAQDLLRPPPPPAPSRARGTGRARGAAAQVAGAEARKSFADFPIGRFEGAPRLVWVAPDLFLHEPVPGKPFRFIRANGEVIAPGRMFTDGGSIPRALWSVKDFSPWTYGPAFLIHDWLFDLHHCGLDTRSFETVRDIMLEGVRTLMETGVCEMNRLAFDLIYAGIDSFIARQVWNKPGCTLPDQD